MTRVILLLQDLAQAAQDIARPSTGVPLPVQRPPGPPPGFSPQEMIKQLVQFVGYFLAIGAIGFRFGVVRRIRGMTDEAHGMPRPDNAAFVGMLGAMLLMLSLLGGLYLESFTRKVVIDEILSGNRLDSFLFRLGMLAVALVGFRLVRTDRSIGWALATIGVFGAALQSVYTGKIGGKVNAVHVLAASTWLGTLLVLTIVGIRGVAKSNATGDQRARVVADLVNSFSPLALTCAAIVAITGVTTAWLHLKRLSALWTTSYGIALIVKLSLVLIVVVLGAWNWRRVRPSLGDEGSEHTIRRSATMELTFAALVLVATSVLVSLPSPK